LFSVTQILADTQAQHMRNENDNSLLTVANKFSNSQAKCKETMKLYECCSAHCLPSTDLSHMFSDLLRTDIHEVLTFLKISSVGPWPAILCCRKLFVTWSSIPARYLCCPTNTEK